MPTQTHSSTPGPPASGERGAREPLLVVPAGGEFEGVISLQGPARIDGRVRGEVFCDDSLWIGPEADVEAPITATEVFIAGTLRGPIHAVERVELAPTASVFGDLTTARLVLAEGAYLAGSCSPV
ncbi:polymer-forming cytoskeletal protein [Myxococcota bacterium]|nr:polymer-forming cytoskeletal protein [Myxococcota bacterium]